MLVWPQAQRKQKRAWTKHGLSPQMWARITDSRRLIHATGDRWQCYEAEPNTVRAKKGARWAEVTFCEKNWCSAETARGQNKLEWDDLRCRSNRLGYKIGFRYVVPSLPRTQVGRQNRPQLLQRPLNTLRSNGDNSRSNSYFASEACNQWTPAQIRWTNNDAIINCYWHLQNRPTESHTNGC